MSNVPTVAGGSKDLSAVQDNKLVGLLKEFGLPHENVVADLEQRSIIIDNLPRYLDSLPAEVKRDARYLSKFVIGAGAGLFDYALNAIWNEVVIDLRKKAIMYGLDIFYDAAVGGSKNREFYSTADNLSAIKDSVLLDTCRKLELIKDTTYKKLKHILEMRNDIGVSHPNDYNINAFELMGWLQTCVSEVLEDRPTEAALQIQEFIKNLKNNNEVIDVNTKSSVELKIKQLPSHLCGNLLRSVFGIYVSDSTTETVRKNISIVAPFIWNSCIDDSRYQLGIVLEGYNANLYKEKYKLGEQFFNFVGGNAYRTETERAIILSSTIEELLDRHNGWDNFHHEGPVAASLWTYVPDQASILKNIADRLFKVVLMCRIGRGVSYNDGVSPSAKPYYDNIIKSCGDTYAPHLMASLSHYEINRKLNNQICRRQAKEALILAKTNVINPRLIECLDYLISRIENDPSCVNDKEFKRLSDGYITWP